MNSKNYFSNYRLQVIRLFAAACSVLFIAGCATSNVLHSEKHVKDAAKAGGFDVYYVEQNLTPKYSAAARPGESPVLKAVAKFGYFEVGQTMAEFGPAVFRNNGLTGTFHQMPATAFELGKLASSGAAPAALVMEFRHGQIQTQGAVTSISLMLNATLYDVGKNSRIWSGQFVSHLGNDPSLGVLKTTRVDQGYVEGLLGMVLEQMAKDEVIALRDNKAILPGGQK